MKQRQGWIIGAALGCLLVAGMGQVEAKEIPIKGKFAGTFLGTRMDLFPLGNPDGVAAGWSTAEVTGNPGKRTSQSVSEAVPTGSTQACPGGVSIIDAQNGIGFGTINSYISNARGDGNSEARNKFFKRSWLPATLCNSTVTA